MSVPLEWRPRTPCHRLVGDPRSILAALILGIALAFGSYLRLAPALAADFPLDDGGLFYLMTHELQGAHYTLPAFTSNNAAHIPFGYPPLAFYMAGAVAQITGSPATVPLAMLAGIALNRTIVRVVLGARAAPPSGTIVAPQRGMHPSSDVRIPHLARWGLLGYLAA